MCVYKTSRLLAAPGQPTPSSGGGRARCQWTQTPKLWEEGDGPGLLGLEGGVCSGCWPPTLTSLAYWMSIMKLCTCFSALLNSSFRATTATSRAVQQTPCGHSRRYDTRAVGLHGPAPCHHLSLLEAPRQWPQKAGRTTPS